MSWMDELFKHRTEKTFLFWAFCRDKHFLLRMNKFDDGTEEVHVIDPALNLGSLEAAVTWLKCQFDSHDILLSVSGYARRDEQVPAFCHKLLCNIYDPFGELVETANEANS